VRRPFIYIPRWLAGAFIVMALVAFAAACSPEATPTPTRAPTATPTPRPTATTPPFTTVTFTTGDGVQLSGKVYGTGQDWVVLAHMLQGEQANLRDLAKRNRDLGVIGADLHRLLHGLAREQIAVGHDKQIRGGLALEKARLSGGLFEHDERDRLLAQGHLRCGRAEAEPKDMIRDKARDAVEVDRDHRLPPGPARLEG